MILTFLRKLHYATDPFGTIVKWNKSRNLNTYDSTTEDNMIAEELEELSAARAVGSVPAAVDAYCDIIVLATGAIHKLGYNPSDAIAETLLEITARKGSIDPTTGKWQKDTKQDPSTLYKARYQPYKE
jgi:hypothetical protein